MKRRFPIWLRIVAGVAFFFAFAFCPYRSTTAPQWSIQVVDEHHKPIAGLMVSEEWEYFDVEYAGNMDHKFTDSQGRVSFPRRTIWLPLLMRCTSSAERCGPHVWILACDEIHHVQGELFWDPKNAWNVGVTDKQSVIIAKPIDFCYGT